MVTGNISPAAQKAQVKAVYDVMARTIQNAAECDFGDLMNKSVADMSAGSGQDLPADAQNAAKQEAGFGNDIQGAMGTSSRAEQIIKEQQEQSPEGTAVEETKLTETEQKLQNALKEALGLTDEELTQLLAENGFVLTDMLIPQRLAVIVADAAAEGDMLKLLTDGNASQLFSEVSMQLNGIVTEAAAELDVTTDELIGALTEKENDNGAAENEEAVLPELPTTVAEETLSDRGQSRTERTADSKTDVTQQQDTAVLEKKVVFEADKEPAAGQNSEGGKENLSGQFVETLISNVDKQFAAQEVFEGYRTNAESIVRQLVDAIKVSVTENTTSMELQLTPENLGKVNLLVAAKGDVITAQLTAQNEAVKTAIENQLVTLKESFQAQGLKVEAVEVTIASHGFEAGRNFEGSDEQQMQENHRRIRNINLDELDGIPAEELTEAEQLAADMMRAAGSIVNYMA